MTQEVRNYFHRTASAFDGLYSLERNRVLRALDRLLRSDIYNRFELTFSRCSTIEGCSVLDVGCGPGRYAVEFARRGARSVLGVDFAPSMLEAAVALARDAEVVEKCRFVCADFNRLNLDERFDYSLAMGVFDYVARPELLLEKMWAVTNRIMLVSFPKEVFPRSTQRRVRYKLKRCPVYFYRRTDIERILASLGIASFEIVGLTGDYFVAVSAERGGSLQ